MTRPLVGGGQGRRDFTPGDVETFWRLCCGVVLMLALGAAAIALGWL